MESEHSEKGHDEVEAADDEVDDPLLLALRPPVELHDGGDDGEDDEDELDDDEHPRPRLDVAAATGWTAVRFRHPHTGSQLLLTSKLQIHHCLSSNSRADCSMETLVGLL